MGTSRLIQREASQKRIQSFAFAIAVVVCVLLAAGFADLLISESGPAQKTALERRINPNDAPAASLVRLPGIGAGRAGTIVAYRENFREQDGNTPAFENPNDLQKVKGIGPKTVENISEWLKFE